MQAHQYNDQWTELEKLAMAATPGEWLWPSQWNGEYSVGVVDEKGLAKTIMTGNGNFRPECQNNMAYVAASNPQVILQLIALARSEAVLREALTKSATALEIVADHDGFFPEGIQIEGQWVRPRVLELEAREALAQSTALRGGDK